MLTNEQAAWVKRKMWGMWGPTAGISQWNSDVFQVTVCQGLVGAHIQPLFYLPIWHGGTLFHASQKMHFRNSHRDG